MSTHGNALPIPVCNQEETAKLLDFKRLVDAVAVAAAELERGTILSPERMVVPISGENVLLSMPATTHDICIHKLVCVMPSNAKLGLPTINGTVTVCDSAKGQVMCLLDGPELTGRRTAAVTMLAIRNFLKKEPEVILLYGTGVQARYHLQAINALHPQTKVLVRGLNEQMVQDFCTGNSQYHPHLSPCPVELPSGVDVVITVTTSTKAVYDEDAVVGRLVIGVGAFKPDMAEIGATTLSGSDIYADDPPGAMHEAGDLIQAGVDWTRVKSLATALNNELDPARPVVFKSVGTAAWDLAAARVALAALGLNA
ncbi:bifunctional Delta(1)-pyrroline-2-carboxylate/Delta(1)-piperideine-2-carboxylate reductase [Pseudomonas sp. RT4P38]